VVVKREANTATAAKFQAVFKKAGARLRVLPVDTGDEEVAAALRPGDSAVGHSVAPASPAASDGAQGDQAPASRPRPAADAGFELLPAGSDLLAAEERTEFEPREVDTSGLRLEGARFAVDEPAPALPAPNAPQLSVAEVGSDLGIYSRGAPPPPVSVPDFDIAETGADLGPGPREVAPAVDFGALTFELAPAGSDLGEARKLAPPAPPNVSRLSLAPAADA